VGFVAGEVALGLVFFEYFGFPCKFLFHHILHFSSISLNWYNGPFTTQVPNASGLFNPNKNKKRFGRN
jgi:hypothetical protein